MRRLHRRRTRIVARMEDAQIHDRIEELVAEEHRLWDVEASGSGTEADRRRHDTILRDLVTVETRVSQIRSGLVVTARLSRAWRSAATTPILRGSCFRNARLC